MASVLILYVVCDNKTIILMIIPLVIIISLCFKCKACCFTFAKEENVELHLEAEVFHSLFPVLLYMVLISTIAKTEQLTSRLLHFF